MNIGFHPIKDQISNWKMEPTDCPEHRRKKKTEMLSNMEKRSRCSIIFLKGILQELKKRK